MRKILLYLFLIFSVVSHSQLAPPKQQINLNLPPVNNTVPKIGMGPAMMIGGAILTTAGLLTPPLLVGGSTTQKQPFYKQGGRAAAIVTGTIVFTVGIGVSIKDF